MLRTFTAGRKRVIALLGSLTMIGVLTLAVIGTPMAIGQATRTWVSGVGDDANPCSRTAPCKTFAGAISKTAARGEINCIDPGGFGGVTITKSITIDCSDVEAGVLVSGTNGIIINAAATDLITLRGLDIEGVGTGLNGIRILNAGAVHVSDVVIRGFRGTGAGNGNGIAVVNSSGLVEVDVSNSSITDNGVTPDGGGIRVQPTSTGAARVTVTGVQLSNNTHGIFADGRSGTGAVQVTVYDSSASGNTNAGFAAVSTTGQGPVELMIDSCSSTYNGGAGVTANGAGTMARVGRSSITGNSTGTLPTNTGVVQSYQTNQIRGNVSDGSRTNITGE